MSALWIVQPPKETDIIFLIRRRGRESAGTTWIVNVYPSLEHADTMSGRRHTQRLWDSGERSS